MPNERAGLALVLVLSLLSAGCFQWTFPISDHDSGVGSTDAGRRDAGQPGRDAGADAGIDVDAGRDAGEPVTPDGGAPDGGSDAGRDGGCRADYCVDDYILWDCSVQAPTVCELGCSGGGCVGLDAGADGGAWVPCCVGGRVDTCFCRQGDICDPFGWADCGDGTCVVGTTCPVER